MSFGFTGGVIGGSVIPTTNFGLFTQIENGTPVENTITETSIVGVGIGTLSVPANTFKIGDTFHLKICGVLNSKNNQTLTIKLHANGIDIGTTGVIQLATTTARIWELSADFTIRNIGGLGVASLLTNGQFFYQKNASTTYEGVSFLNLDTTTFDTEILNTLDVVAQWGFADPLNSIYTSQLVLNKVF